MHRADKRAGLIVFAGRGLLRGGRAGGAPRALCTETGLRLLRVAPRVRGPRARTGVPRVVLVLVMVRRRCIHTAFKRSGRPAIQ